MARSLLRFAMHLNRFGQGAFLGPSVAEPVADQCLWQTELSRPFGGSLCATAPGYGIGRAFVPSLIGPRGPSAVSWLVSTVVVNTIKRMFGGRRSSHIGQELYEEVPRWTNGDAPTTVVSVGWVHRVFAAAQHCLPCVELLAPTVTMNTLALRHSFACKTSTTSGIAL